MSRLVSQKMGISIDQQVLVIDGPAESVDAINLPAAHATSTEAGQTFDHVILFAITQEDLDSRFPQYKQHINSTGKLWIAWPKGGRLSTDLNIKEVIRIGYNHGLVESTNLRIDNTWTALKFTHPKPGKQYNNSYGTLPQHQ